MDFVSQKTNLACPSVSAQPRKRWGRDPSSVADPHRAASKRIVKYLGTPQGFAMFPSVAASDIAPTPARQCRSSSPARLGVGR
mmetsp:Transcript_13033/g.26046  ORF Transcript_13033/g.26046 Transcript_13033/m.26046 type:complete len:83 (-) Transcript_13033:315-563(-)